MLTGHTPVERVGQVAAYCNVKTMVLNPFVTGMARISHLGEAQPDSLGDVITSHALVRIGVSGSVAVVLNPLSDGFFG